MALSQYLDPGTGAKKPRYSYATDPSTLRYKQFADEAAQQGITDPNAVDQYAVGKNQEWGRSHGIDANPGWLMEHPWAVPLGILGGGLGAAAIGAGAAGGAVAGAGEGAAAGGLGAGETLAGSMAGLQAGDEAFAGAGSMAVPAASTGGSSMDFPLQGGGSGSAMSRILSGGGSTADWLSMIGNLGSTGLGILGSRNAARGFGDLSSRYLEMGAPSRARYEASMSPGFDPTTIPGYSGAMDSASRGLLARLAATGGNPYGNPGGLIEANRQLVTGTALPAIEAYQRMNAGTGGYAGFNAAAPAAANARIGAGTDVYGQIGSGLAGLLSPQPSLIDTLRGLNMSGLT